MLKSEAVLAVSPTISEERKELLKKIQFRIKSVLQARQNKYVLMNAPNDKLDKIISILPGMRSPTVLPLAEEGWSSVHTVINRETFWEVIDELKQAGAEGILVCPIEKWYCNAAYQLSSAKGMGRNTKTSYTNCFRY